MPKPKKPQMPGMIKGLGVTFKEMVNTLKPDSKGGGPVTVWVVRLPDGRRKRFLHEADAQAWAADRDGTVEKVTT